MSNKELNLKPISKIDFGRRKLSSKEFTLLWIMVLNHFSKIEEAINFYWWDTALYNKSTAIFLFIWILFLIIFFFFNKIKHNLFNKREK